MSYYGSGRSSRRTYRPTPTLRTGGGTIAGAGKDGDAGKFRIDLTDPLGSAGDAIGSAASFGSGIVGGVAGAIGSVGPDAEDASIGQLAEDFGRIPGGIGDFQLPYLGNDPEREGARLSAVPGAVIDVLSTPMRAVERTVAGQRVEGGPLADFDPRSLLPGGALIKSAADLADDIKGDDRHKLPPDLQARLDAGESVDTIADELVARGAGFSSDPLENLAGQILLDPLNLVAPGASKAAQSVRGAGVAIRAADDLGSLGLSTRAIGAAYNAASRGMTRAGAALVDRVLGPTTSGVLHALGTKPYQRIRGGLGSLDLAYRDAFDDAFARGAAQMPRAVIGHYMADEAAMLLRRFGPDAMDRLPDVAPTVERRLDVVRAIGRDDLERRAQELLARFAPAFDGVSPDDLAAVTARKLATITGASVEDAARALGPVDRETAQTIHLALYGKAGDDLARVKRDLRGSKSNIDVERLTLVADDTLTDTRADDILSGVTSAVDAVEHFPVLRNRFMGKDWTDADVRAFVERLKSQDALITTVRRPTTGKNPLPKPLGAWRGRYLDDGYDLGFAPKGGWKVVTDEDGTPIFADPFVHFVSDADPVTMRNPLGRFADGLMRGVTQTTIISESRQRLVDAVVSRGLPISPNQARAIHRTILEEAAERGVTPRSLVADTTLVHAGDGTTQRIGVIDAAFQRHLSADEYATLTRQIDPTYLVMSAFQGNWKTVGLTQYMTGGVKRTPGLGSMAAAIAERVYPAARFSLNPLFQLQELIESKILNAMRGVTSRRVPEDVAAVYRELTQLPELRHLAESGYFLNIANGESVRRFLGVNTPVGRALSRFANVADQKADARVAQVLSEHADEFKAALERVNPRAWRTLEEAYGTTDPRVIAHRYLAERIAIGAGEDINAAMAAYDASRAIGASVAEETVWQAFRTTFEQASRQAFKTHYFNPQRGWLERSLNHPYLGLYPLSYMAKVAAEFTRFLVRRPFGLDAPLTGLAAVEKTQRAYLAAVADDAEFRQYLQDHPDALYLALQLIPGDPTSLGAGAPAWARHVSADLQAGRPVTVETLGREAMDTGQYALGAVRGPVTIAEGAADVLDLSGDVFENLQKAAAMWDGQG